MLRSQYSTTWMDGKAIPLYKVTSSISTYTIKSGSSYEKTGPFTAAQKTSLTGTSFNPSGTTWTERTTITSYTSVANSQNMQPVPAVDVVTMYNLGWFAQGTFVQVDAVNNYWGFYENQTITTTQYANLEAVRDNPNNFPGFTALGKACIAGLVNVFSANHSGTGQYDLTLNGQSFTRGPHNQGVYDTLTGSGVYSSTDFNTNTNYTYGYTTDSERKLGSILHNLWSAALYNETASVTKYKTVYDPCPAGFTVPTKATYATPSSFTGYPRTGMRVNSGGTSASTSVTDSGTKGYYWTDHSCNMSYNTGAKDAITSYTDYDKSYILETTSSSASVKKNIRASAASIRPMTDPRATSIAGHATPAQVAAQNPIEGVTMGSEL